MGQNVIIDCSIIHFLVTRLKTCDIDISILGPPNFLICTLNSFFQYPRSCGFEINHGSWLHFVLNCAPIPCGLGEHIRPQPRWPRGVGCHPLTAETAMKAEIMNYEWGGCPEGARSTELRLRHSMWRVVRGWEEGRKSGRRARYTPLLRFKDKVKEGEKTHSSGAIKQCNGGQLVINHFF